MANIIRDTVASPVFTDDINYSDGYLEITLYNKDKYLVEDATTKIYQLNVPAGVHSIYIYIEGLVPKIGKIMGDNINNGYRVAIAGKWYPSEGGMRNLDSEYCLCNLTYTNLLYANRNYSDCSKDYSFYEEFILFNKIWWCRGL